MKKIIKNILKTLEDNGYEAYLVGGFIRDKLLHIKSYDVDICTNAKPEDLEKLFNIKVNDYGSLSFKINKYSIDITTFRKELEYVKRKPTKLVYVDTLEEDIKRRDFTINAICMNSKGKIIDLVGGLDDIHNKIVRMIGDTSSKLQEDPLRILRAIRIATILDFKIEDNLLQSIKDNNKLVLTLSPYRKRSELDKILSSKNFKKGLELLKDTDILSLLQISYDNIKYTKNILGMYAQLNIGCDLEFTKEEKRNIININEKNNKRGS